jgi:membrane-bound lytic murein transglycosylase MltF
MLVTFNRTHYFADRLQQHGMTYDAGMLFEKFLNERLKMTTVEVHVVFIPVTRDRLFQALAEGKGDIAAAALTVTPERETEVNFSPPIVANIREIVVTSATQPPVATAEDLSGRSVHVRKSSSFYQSLTELNHRLAAQGKAPVNIVTVPEALETEDLLEMANADLIPITIADDYLAEFWAMVFDHIRLQPAAVKTGDEIAWAVRKNAPELLQAVDAFARANPKGSAHYNAIYQVLKDGLREERDVPARDGEVPADSRAVPEVRRSVRSALAASGRTGLSGVAAGSGEEEPRRRCRRDAGSAIDRRRVADQHRGRGDEH